MSSITEIAASRELINNLTLRDLRSRYKRSVLGWAWSMLNPLATVAIYTIVFKYFFHSTAPVGTPSGMQNYGIFLFCGILPWNYFNASTINSMSVLIGNAGLIKKVYFPRENLVISLVLSNLVTFLIELSVIGVLLIAFGNDVLPWIPVVLILVFMMTLFVTGIGLVLSVLNVYFRDLQYLVGTILLQVVFFLTPIIYPAKQAFDAIHSPVLRRIYTASPLFQFIEAFHRALYDLRWPTLTNFVYLFAWSVATLVVGYWVFGRFEGRLAEEL